MAFRRLKYANDTSSVHFMLEFISVSIHISCLFFIRAATNNSLTSVLSGILSFRTGTTRSRRRSFCTPSQSPTSPACDQRRLLSHISNDLGSHIVATGTMEPHSSLHKSGADATNPADLQKKQKQKAQSPDGTLGIQARNVTWHLVFKTLTLWCLTVAGT